jgi:hypothetical protein
MDDREAVSWEFPLVDDTEQVSWEFHKLQEK